MVNKDAGQARAHMVRWLAVSAAVACAWLVGGCAASGAGSGASGGAQMDIVTPSDEPDSRRRARIRLELASSYFESGQTTVALDEVKQAVAIDPTYADAHNLRGLIFMRLNDFGPAQESFRRALALRPGDANLTHNYGWLLCQQRQFAEANQQFARALAEPTYTARSKTLMAQGLCHKEAGNFAEAEQSLLKAYELDAGNPVVSYNLATVVMRRGDARKAQFYIRRLNNSELANSESLWLGIKVERALGDTVAMRQLVDQLRKRFPESREWSSYERGLFDD